MARLGLKTDGSAGGVTVLEQGQGVELLLRGTADCISAMSYDGFGRLIDKSLEPDELVVFSYEDEGAATLEDGLYVLEEVLADPDYVAALAAFLQATMRGWQWARENPVEAARIVLECNTGGPLTEESQVRMMHEINRLTEGSDGVLDPADYEQTVATLLTGGADPVITKAPTGAWTHIISDAAKLGAS